MRAKFFLFQIVLIVLLNLNSNGQTTVFFQGFENASLTCSENWGYSGGTTNTELFRTGTRSARVGRAGESNTLLFNTVNISSITGVQLQIYHSVKSGTGPGMDTREGAGIQVSLNGGGWTNIGRVGGFGDINWGWNTTGGSASASAGCTVFQSPNPINYAVPVGTSTIAVRVVSVTAGNCASYNTNMNNVTASLYDRGDEGLYIDDVKLTSSGDIPGIWTGAISTDWFDCKNWYYNKIPASTSDVTIDHTALNPCVINTASNAFCRDIIISSSTNTSSSLTIQNGSSLVSNGNMTVNKTAGSGMSKFEITGTNCIFSCNNVTLNGSSSGATNAQFLNEYHLNTVTINGSFILNSGGKLDMNSVSDYGILNLKGNYTNNGLESDFTQTNSFVILSGTGTQSISTNSFTEVFSNLTMNKTSGSAILSSNINVENTLTLQSGFLDLNSRTLSILNNFSSGIQRTGGGIISEKSNNSSKVLWQINSEMGEYIYPFIRTDGSYISVSFEHASGNAGNVTVSTYGTPGNNLPWPSTPVAVSNLNNSLGQNDSSATVDRFWNIDVSGSAVANLTLTYAPDELPTSPYNSAGNVKAQNFSGGQWQPYLPSQSSGQYFVSIPSVSTFSTFAMTNIASPLPIELLSFTASRKNEIVITNWSTASETNNDKFTVERSENGKEFIIIGEIKGAGNSYTPLHYQFADERPLSGDSYYRLKQTDYDGQFSYSKIVALHFNNNISQLRVYPNPVKDWIIIPVDESGKYRIHILSIDGKSIFSTIDNVDEGLLKLFTANLQAGLYLLQLQNENGFSQAKFFKE